MGSDTISAGGGNNFANGGGDDDFIQGGSGNEWLEGGQGNDHIEGLAGNDRLFGGSGTSDDTAAFLDANFGTIITNFNGVTDQPSDRTLTGSAYAYNYRALTNTGDDYLDGGAGDDIIDGQDGADTMIGGAGSDTFIIDNAGDRVIETTGGGRDTAFASTSYTLAAGQEIEALQLLAATGRANLHLTGNEFGQTLVGNNGSNMLDGKGGADLLLGRGGADTFVFSTTLGTSNLDHIADFATEDTVRLAKSVFAALGLGQLAESAFKNLSLGKADADDRIIYNQKYGDLWYDPDGSGSIAGVKFAVLDNKVTVTHADFLVV